MSVGKFVHAAISFQNQVKRLKEKSSYFPLITTEYTQDSSGDRMGIIYWASTLVRIFRDGKWYIVHCAENICLNDNVSEADCLKRLMKSAYDTMHLYVLNDHRTMDGEPQDEDKLQISEEERLKSHYMKFFNSGTNAQVCDANPKKREQNDD